MSKLEGKGYKEYLHQLFSTTCLREEDLDHKAIALLDALQQKGKAQAACQSLEQAIHGRERDRVNNWRAYVYTLLRGFDGATYKELKRGGLKSDASANRTSRVETNKKNSFPVSDHVFRSEAQVFVPGAGSWVKARDDSTEVKDSTKKELFTKILVSDDGRGNATVALKAFAKGEEIFREIPLALVYAADDAPWLKEMRSELEKEDSVCAWQYCVAVHCLYDELPRPGIDGLKPLSKDARLRLEELCGAPASMKEFEPSALALITSRHLLRKAGMVGNCGRVTQNEEILAARLDALAARTSRNGFQIMDLTRRPPTSADGLFHRISFFNHCCLGMNNASWTWDGNKGVLVVKASRDIAEGEELTISYIAKPWCDLAKPARQRYLQQNFNFLCLCTACALSAEEEEKVQRQLGPQTEAAKGKSGKLGNLLTRWLERGKDSVGDDDVVLGASRAEAPPAKDTKPSGPLTDQDRLSRVLARCEKDGLSASHEQAQAALRAEDGHVGKTVIRLKRQQSEATPLMRCEDSDGKATYAYVALAVAACISLIAVVRIRQRSAR